MRIHTNNLTADDIYAATARAGLSRDHVTFTEHGSRSRARAFNVKLTGTSHRQQNGGRNGGTGAKAATWDEWGMFIAELFRRDPNMTIPSAYPTAGDFDRMTAGRYDTLTPADQHRNHRWDYSGIPRTFECACGAVRGV